MSNATPRLITRTTTRKAVLLLVTTVTEVFETTGETVEELPLAAPGLRKASTQPAPMLRASGAR
jgi:hypothetical protein